MPDPAPNIHLSESNRVEAFSDAVFAIIITILVLDFRLPPHEPGHLLSALAGLWASVLAFVLSFLRVSVVWLNHHALFVRIRRVDRRLLWMNFAVLGTCMIIPFPTAVLADALRVGDPADLRVAVVLYTLVGALQLAAWLPIYHYLRNHRELAEPRTGAAYFDAQRTRLLIGLGADAIAVLMAAVAPIPALVLWTLSLIFIAATSDGIRGKSSRASRHPHALEEERET